MSPEQTLLTRQPTETLPALNSGKNSTPAAQPTSDISIHTNISEQLSETPVPQPASTEKNERTRHIKRYVALLLCGIIAVALFVTWTNIGASTSATPSAITDLSTPQSTPTLTTNQTGSGNVDTIQVYVIGAVKHPGVYTLPADARIYQLLQAAGGTLGSANLALVNMAAKLSDGQEVYVVSVGETPPPSISTGASASTPTSSGQTSSGSLVNINTASLPEMTQSLHISSTTANHIISYRQLHGNYSSIDQLLQVISATTYKKIKDKITV